ncbi:hypothetical protein [Paraburkholderia atlantica]|uniref:hypothetical protein n=1 Tax=Paraburkholderia atlantica TaxID=2654982 RepID=UPI0002E95E20|nr:hypothetical protein [Paraburkholderia atlantica]
MPPSAELFLTIELVEFRKELVAIDVIAAFDPFLADSQDFQEREGLCRVDDLCRSSGTFARLARVTGFAISP